MSSSVLRSEAPLRAVITDTVVINYFTALGRLPLLADILGGVVQVPTLVYDRRDTDTPEASASVLSELEQGRRLHQRRANDPEAAPHLRRRSAAALPHFEALAGHVASGTLVSLELSDSEFLLYAELRDKEAVRQFGLTTGLGRGEAAALAIAETRSMDLATDDQDCIKVGLGRNPAFQPRRIRALLLRAVDQGLIALPEARSIHLSMVNFGFWDRGRIEL